MAKRLYMSLPECIAGYTGTVMQQSDGSTRNHFPCNPCPQGRYKEQIGWFECNHCPEGTTTTGTGHTSVNDCGRCCMGHVCSSADDYHYLNIYTCYNDLSILSCTSQPN